MLPFGNRRNRGKRPESGPDADHLYAVAFATPHRWTAQYVPDRRDDATPAMPLPYGTDPEWTGAADVLPLDAPRLDMLDSQTDGEATILELQIASSRDADVITLHADRPIQDVTITADDHPPVTSIPTYPDDVDAREWPYELRFYDPPSEGFRMTLRLPGPQPPRIALSDYTVGLGQLPGFIPRPGDLERSPTTGPTSSSSAAPTRRGRSVLDGDAAHGAMLTGYAKQVAEAFPQDKTRRSSTCRAEATPSPWSATELQHDGNRAHG